MIKFLKVIKKIYYILLYKKYKFKKKIRLKILFNNIKKYGDITIIFSNLLKKNIINDIYKIIYKKYKNILLKIIIKNYFLNIYLNNNFYIKIINYFFKKKFNIKKLIYNKNNNKKKIIIDYSSPNSNKPLHIGHLRNILIGDTISNIYKKLGYNIIKSQIINDRGIHICKTIISWKLFFKKKKINKYIKSDHYVGKLYFKFEKEFKKEIKYISNKYNIDKKNALNKSNLFKKINKELIRWENNNKRSIKLWKKINNLVYKGFNKTYKILNIKFNETLYESNTYIIGKKNIIKNIKKNIFILDKDKSIYYIYKNKKIILLRKNGTSLYITQEIGTLLYRIKKYKKFYLLIYVVGNEQKNYFNLFFNIIEKININININKLYHLSYNTVNYLGKKIKSRNYKNIIFIDCIIKKMYNYVKKNIIFNINIKNKKKIYKNITIGTIKYQFLKINPNKIINFNFKNTLNLKGNTCIYIQYTYIRIYSILKKNINNKYYFIKKKNKYNLKNIEKDIIIYIIKYYKILKDTIKYYDPSILINYIYLLSKKINNFYQNNRIYVKNKYEKNIRLNICLIISKILYNIMKILNIPIIKKI
ncbi:MAG: arginine--tRNA ligase [Flavobacteriales endosymbiont of Rhyzopertha dominica]|nr:MAG: arginine--tRNA ligase [Candidatus Shikimatogenerans bostrichidophilus]